MNKGMWKTTMREIKGSLGRYVAILAIVMLGGGIVYRIKGDDTGDDRYGKRLSGGAEFL